MFTLKISHASTKAISFSFENNVKLSLIIALDLNSFHNRSVRNPSRVANLTYLDNFFCYIVPNDICTVFKKIGRGCILLCRWVSCKFFSARDTIPYRSTPKVKPWISITMGAAYSNYMMQAIVYITVSDSRGYWLLCQRASSLLQEIFIFKNSKRDSSW